MAKGGTQEVVTRNQLDPSTQGYLDEFRRRARQGFEQFTSGQNRVPGVDPLFGESLDALGGLNPAIAQALGLGQNLGFASQTGLTGVQNFFDPFERQVVGGLQGDFDRQRELAGVRANQLATQAGAFGGNRQAILEAELLGDINRNETQQLANVRSGGFQNAVNNLLRSRGQAGQLGLAGLGLGGQLGFGLSGMLSSLGMQRRGILEAMNRDPDLRFMQGLGLLQPGLTSLGAGTTTEITPMSGSPFGSALGGLLSGAGLSLSSTDDETGQRALPLGLGLGLGGGLGLLGGLFG